MKRFFSTTGVTWNTILVATAIFACFILPLFSFAWYHGLYRVVYSMLYFSAIFSLQKRGNYLLALFIVTLLLEWISGILNLDDLMIVSKAVNVLFFLVIVVSLIRQIATARVVTATVILGSVASYLLLGIIYSIFIAMIIHHDPKAFNVNQSDFEQAREVSSLSLPMYWGFVTMTTVGYGDVLPLKPYTRSLATFIAVSGQFYMAIIVAMLVGKFAAQNDFKNSDTSD